MKRVAVVGVGSVGGYLASQLLGHAEGTDTEVLLCVRRPFRELVVDSRVTGSTTRHAVDVVTDPVAADGPVDLVVLSTKATHDPRPWLDALCGDDTVVLVAQNGVEQESRVGPLVPGPVLPAVVYCGTEMLEPGHVIHHNSGFLLVPEEQVAERVATVFPSGVIRPTSDWLTRAWQKLTLNVISNGITALTGRRLGVLTEPEAAGVARRLAEECSVAGRAVGADLSDSWPREAMELVQAAPSDQGTSMLYDRLAGAELEWDAIHGAVRRAAASRGHRHPGHRHRHRAVGLAAALTPGAGADVASDQRCSVNQSVASRQTSPKPGPVSRSMWLLPGNDTNRFGPGAFRWTSSASSTGAVSSSSPWTTSRAHPARRRASSSGWKFRIRSREERWNRGPAGAIVRLGRRALAGQFGVALLEGRTERQDHLLVDHGGLTPLRQVSPLTFEAMAEVDPVPAGSQRPLPSGAAARPRHRDRRLDPSVV